MSLSECERFEADLKSNEALRAAAEKARAGTSPLAGLVALAASKGYGVTAEDARQHLKARAATAGKVISDAQLDAVAGGAMWEDPAFWSVDLSF
jgi:hypothetical protein